MTFDDLNLIEPLRRAVRAEGYEHPTPIQLQAIPHVLTGRDLVGCAQTGTGKTAAFALPILQRLVQGARPGERLVEGARPGERPVVEGARPGVRRGRPCVLVLAPTRELAAQIGESFTTYGRHTGLVTTVIFGGVGQDAQVRAVRNGVDILVATPGRLLDLMGQKLVSLAGIEIFVLDEADRMLDMGFIHDVRRVMAVLPTPRQSLLFSATMPDEIADLAARFLVDPVRVDVVPESTPAERIEQRVYFVEKNDKRALLIHLLRDPTIARVLVFTRTKHGANRVVEYLERAGIGAAAIHGNKSQGARERALANFKSGSIRALVATDIAARGIDVEGISHVINFDLPNIPDSYVHRIGRTARAGASGIALSFCDAEEREFLVDIERLMRAHVERVLDHPHASHLSPPPPSRLDGRRGPSSSPPSGGRPRGPGRPQGGRSSGGGRPAAAQASGRSPAPRPQPQAATAAVAPRPAGLGPARGSRVGSWRPRAR